MPLSHVNLITMCAIMLSNFGNSTTVLLLLWSLRKSVNKGAFYVNQKHRGKPLLFHDKCSGFFYVHYLNNLVYRTYGLTPEGQSVLLNPHSDATTTWIWCIRPSHDTP